MPSSLRFVLALLGLSAVGAPVSIYLLHHETTETARITAETITVGHVEAGKALLARYGCVSCHEIEGIAGKAGKVGPPLAGIAHRVEIAGRLSNQPDNLILWLMHPQTVVPGNGMPDQGVTERDARDIAAYLYTLR